MRTVALILPSQTYRADAWLAAARTLRASVVVASEGPQAMAASMGDAYVRIDFRRPGWSAERIAAAAAAQPLDAVIAADDAGVVIAAEAGRRLGLPHNDPAAVAATRDKAEMRRRCAAAGVPQPRFAVTGPADDVAAVASAVGYPVVVKPVSLSASRGVIRADDAGAAVAAASRIRTLLAECGEDAGGPLLVEEYVPGAEFAVEGLLSGGELVVLAVFDKPDPMEGPFFEETLLVSPARVDAAGREALAATAAAAARALGLAEGPVHAELRLGPDGVVVLEIAARSIGGRCGEALRFGMLGETLETVLLRHALGFPPASPQPHDAASGVLMLPIPEAGTLVAVGGQEAAQAVPGIVAFHLTIPVGRPVVPLPEGDRYLGFLFAKGPTADAVEEALRQAYAELDVVIEQAPSD